MASDDVSQLASDRTYPMRSRAVLANRPATGRALIRITSAGLACLVLLQLLYDAGTIAVGFANWRPVLYAYLVWAAALGAGQVLIHRERGQRALFLLPALLFTAAMVIFPTIFGLYIAATDW